MKVVNPSSGRYGQIGNVINIRDDETCILEFPDGMKLSFGSHELQAVKANKTS